jgi:cytochrome P450
LAADGPFFPPGTLQEFSKNIAEKFLQMHMLRSPNVALWLSESDHTPMKRRYPDGPRLNLPLVVMAQMLPAFFRSDPLAFGLGIARRFGDIAHYSLGPLHIYQLNRPELIRQVLVEQAEKFHKPRVLKRALRPIAGDGLLTSDGDPWRQQRKLMQPAFHHRQLQAYADVMVELATSMVESFVDGEVRNIGDEMAKLTLAVVVKSLFGADLPFDAGELGQSILAALDAANQRMNSVLPAPSWAPTRRNLRLRRALRRQEAMLRILVEARRASGESRNDLLSVLLAAVDEDSGARMSDQQLRDEMMTLFGAGQETTATLLTWTWYLLSRHPEVEEKLVEELDLVLAGRAPVMADLAKLPYTEMVIREALRLYPPAPMFGREPIEDVSIGGYDVPKGSLIVVNTYALQRDARFFEDPESYHPERFASGWEARIPRYAYLPFGGGPRVCIGGAFAMMEARLVLATVAQRYKLSLDSPEEIAPVQLVTLRPGRPIRVSLEKRRPSCAPKSLPVSHQW